MKQTISRVAGALALIVLVAPAVRADEVKETVHVVITGGSHPGTYDVTGTRGGCSEGLTGHGDWGNQLSVPKDRDPKHFNSLQLIVPNPKKAAHGTKDFYISFGFGSILQRSAEWKIETREGEHKSGGSGTVTVLDKGATAKVDFDVTATDGTHFKGSIDCKSVLRAK